MRADGTATSLSHNFEGALGIICIRKRHYPQINLQFLSLTLSDQTQFSYLVLKKPYSTDSLSSHDIWYTKCRSFVQSPTNSSCTSYDIFLYLFFLPCLFLIFTFDFHYFYFSLLHSVSKFLMLPFTIKFFYLFFFFYFMNVECVLRLKMYLLFVKIC